VPPASAAKTDRATRSGTRGRWYSCNTIFQRLAQHLQDVATARRQFIQQEHAVVGPRHVAGHRHLPPADQPYIRDRVVRDATGARGGQGGAGAGAAGDAVEAGGLQRIGQRSAGRMVVSRCANIDLPAPGGPMRRTLWSQRLHSVHPNMQRSMTCQPMDLLPRRQGQYGSPRFSRPGQLERTQVLGHGDQLVMSKIFSENVLDIVDMTAYLTRAIPRGLTSRTHQPSPQEDPRCLSSLRS
jgi:hypothetical protein